MDVVVQKKTTTKHLENIQNAVLRNRASQNERTNIYKNTKLQFEQKLNAQIFRKSDECTFWNKTTTKHLIK